MKKLNCLVHGSHTTHLSRSDHMTSAWKESPQAKGERVIGAKERGKCPALRGRGPALLAVIKIQQTQPGSTAHQRADSSWLSSSTVVTTPLWPLARPNKTWGGHVLSNDVITVRGQNRLGSRHPFFYIVLLLSLEVLESYICATTNLSALGPFFIISF